jgi:lysophospholipase L1-like esterase
MKLFLMLISCLAIAAGGSMAKTQVNPCDVKLGSFAEVNAVPKDAKLDWWMPRHQEILARNKQGNVDLIFIGDSITHRWGKYKDSISGEEVWNKYYAKRKAVNMGFGGDRTQHVLWRMQNGEIDGINPKLAVLLIGTNNCNSESSTPERIADGIKAIICELRTRLPETKVLVLGIFPKGSNEQRKDKTGDATYNPRWEKTDKVNAIISKIADGKMIYYLNINKAFLNKKGLWTREISPDLSHLSEKGYQIWAEAMEPTIVKLMGETE